jgi:HlyD family secretion protein
MNKSLDPRENLDVQALLRSRSSARKRVRIRAWAWAVLALAISALVGFAVLGVGRGSKDVQYLVERVIRGNLTVTVTATGSVQPTNKIDISSELSGTVKSVFVDYNSIVAAGQLLAELDTDKLQATLDSSRAKLAAAKAKIDDAKATIIEKERDLSRKKRLVQVQAAATQDLDQAQAAYDRSVASLASNRADVAVAEADVRLNETNLSRAYIRSSIDGLVLKRNVDPGQTIASSLQVPVLFSIAEDLKLMELQVDVDEADVGRVRIGQTATFSVDAFPERRFPAAIRDIRFASETIQGVVTYKAVLKVDNSELLLRPGMTATSEIQVARIDSAVLIPNAAIRYAPASTNEAPTRGFLSRLLPGPPILRASSRTDETGRDRSVWILRDGVPTRVKIVIGQSNGEQTELVGGDLKPDDLVIVDQTTNRS